jgi:hypothetical protein
MMKKKEGDNRLKMLLEEKQMPKELNRQKQKLERLLLIKKSLMIMTLTPA